MPKENTIAALDIGASKVCCLIGVASKDNIIDVVGYGVFHHDCLRHGVVTDIKGLSEAIGRALYEAEETSGKKVQSAYFNISGSHIRGIKTRGQVLISDRDNEITRHDIDRVTANAKSLHMPFERDIVFTVNRGYTVDGEKGIVSPAGMFGLKLEADFYLVTARISAIDNLKKAIRQAGIIIKDYVISGVATASAILSDHEKEIGVILVDVGADLTEVLVFLEGKLSHIGVLPLGGDNITKAISDKMRISEGAAEKIKIEHGTLDEAGSEEKISMMVDSRKRSISLKELRKIILAEYSVIFNAVKKELQDSGCAQDASSGVVINGQPAMTDGCLELAELILNFPVKIGHVIGLGSCPKPLPSHIYAASVGLLKYGAKARLAQRSILNMGPKNLVMTIARRARSLYRDYF